MGNASTNRITTLGLVLAGLFALVSGLLTVNWIGSTYWAHGATPAFDPSRRPDFKEPIVLSSKDGVLEVRLTAQQGEATLDTVAKPVRNFLLFGYEVVRGTASNGEKTGKNQYPAPTLQVYPGDKLIVHMDNALSGLTIRDLYDPAFTPKDGKVPMYPEQLTQAPINLHTHGLRVSPKGNSDNVVLHIGAGVSNTYNYEIREDHPHGAYWYHPHLHQLTSPQTYLGLAGILAVGRLDGSIPLVTEKKLPIRNMVLQYNFVFDRKGGQATLNNANWSQYVSTLTPPKDDELAKGTYRPLLAPVNFLDSDQGTEYFTVWWAGPLGVNNNRGRLQFVPSSLQSFQENPGGIGRTVPANPSLPDYLRDVQYTVNGQFQPTIRTKPGQTEIWVLSNVSDMAYMNVQLTETATGKHPKIAILATDGNPGKFVRYPPTDNGTRLLIPPATRYAIAVTMPETGDLILEMPPIGEGAETISEPGILYTNDGSENPPAITGVVSALPSTISHDDGFFAFPTQVLARAVPSGEGGETVAFTEGQALSAPNDGFFDTAKFEPDLVRTLNSTGGFLNELASKNDPKAFVYAFNNQGFPNAPLLQPRLNTIEEWRIYNRNNDSHPIHVHVNDFQVTRVYNPLTGLTVGPGEWEADTADLARPTLLVGEDVGVPAELFIRTKFEDYIGLFVMHCHRLNHEDNGLMLMVNIIPSVSTYAVAIPGGEGTPAAVQVYDGDGDKLVATVTPFERFEGTPSAAMGDVDGDSIYDLVVGAGEGHAPEVVVYSGESGFKSELTRFSAFDASAKGGVNVASAQIDGSTSDNIIVGSGPGIESKVKVFAYNASSDPTLFSSFTPYPDDRSGVKVASGFVSLTSGRNSIVTAPGPGAPAVVKVFDYWLMKPAPIKINDTNLSLQMCSKGDGKPSKIAEFKPFGPNYRDGVSLATGWLYGQLGGAKRIIVGQLGGPGEVKVFSTGSALQGGPTLELRSPVLQHDDLPEFFEVYSFAPFDGGVRVATTSTTVGADLLVSGMSDKTAEVRKYEFVLSRDDANSIEAKQLGEVYTATNAPAPFVGGD
ncbi:MAG: multicopper oxidase domain-containing protein [Methyloceanibacter sp.]|nr:multicopper oxidase domain-containing protein [Methyloceanibacter sp.]